MSRESARSFELAANKGVVRKLAIPVAPNFKTACFQRCSQASLTGPAMKGRGGSVDIRQVYCICQARFRFRVRGKDLLKQFLVDFGRALDVAITFCDP